MSDQQDIKPNVASLLTSKPIRSLGAGNIISGKSLLKATDPSRLPSFKRPRDLTLSSTYSTALKPPLLRQKKKVTPNIPFKRDKGSKLTPSLSERGIKKSPSKNKKFRGKQKPDREYIQTKGSLFGEGNTVEPSLSRNSHGSSHHGGNRTAAESNVMKKPVFDRKSAYNYDKKYEEEKLKELMRDDFIDDPDDDCSNGTNLPIRLPLNCSFGNTQNLSMKIGGTVPYSMPNKLRLWSY